MGILNKDLSQKQIPRDFVSRPVYDFTMQKYLFITVLFISLISASISSAIEIQTNAKQAYIIDFETGSVLYKKNETQRMPTASMSKVMTMLAVFKALEDGRLKLDEELLVSEKAWRKGGSKMFVEVGKKIKVEDLIRGVIIQSGNDATIVLAEALGGTEEAFGKKITELAHDIGMKDSNFVNASGWPDDRHYSTAKDLAILARHLIKTYPQYYGYYSEPEFTFSDITQANRNPLLGKDIGGDGIKTGHTEEAGYGLIGSGHRDGRRVIMILNGMESAKERKEESARLLDWSLRNFKNKQIFEEGQVLSHADVVLGTKETLPLRVNESVFLTVPLASADEITAEAVFDNPLIAPIEEGARIGTVKISIPSYGQIEKPLFAAETIKEPGFLQKTFAKFSLFLKQNL